MNYAFLMISLLSFNIAFAQESIGLDEENTELFIDLRTIASGEPLDFNLDDFNRNNGCNKNRLIDISNSYTYEIINIDEQSTGTVVTLGRKVDFEVITDRSEVQVNPSYRGRIDRGNILRVGTKVKVYGAGFGVGENIMVGPALIRETNYLGAGMTNNDNTERTNYLGLTFRIER